MISKSSTTEIETEIEINCNDTFGATLMWIIVNLEFFSLFSVNWSGFFLVVYHLFLLFN